MIERSEEIKKIDERIALLEQKAEECKPTLIKKELNEKEKREIAQEFSVHYEDLVHFSKVSDDKEFNQMLEGIVDKMPHWKKLMFVYVSVNFFIENLKIEKMKLVN